MDVPEDRRMYRHWVELRDKRDGSVRELPLQGIKKIQIPTKKGAPLLPDEVVLHVKDGLDVLEATDLEGIAAQLRERYSDEDFERFLRSERDPGAEQQKWQAMSQLIDILVKAALDGVRRESASSAAPLSVKTVGADEVPTKPGRPKLKKAKGTRQRLPRIQT